MIMSVFFLSHFTVVALPLYSQVTKAEISHAVPDAKKAMLAPPKEAAKARFFPDAVFEEDRDYLLSTLEKEGATDMQVC
jgi:hypothetical protein